MKQRIKNWCLKHLFNAIVEEDIIRFKRGNLYVGNKKLTKQQAQVMFGKARQIVDNDAYKLIMQEINYLAKEKIYHKDDKEFGKAMLYCASLLNNKISSLSTMYDKSNMV